MLSQDSNTTVQHCNAYAGMALEWCASRLSWLMPKGVLSNNLSLSRDWLVWGYFTLLLDACVWCVIDLTGGYPCIRLKKIS